MISFLIMLIILLVIGLWAWSYLYKQWKKAELEEEGELIDDTLEKIKITKENYKKISHIDSEESEQLKQTRKEIHERLNLFNKRR